MIAPELDGAAVLDLFAGTGALGLEALSRGADRAVFVERDPITTRILRENVARVTGDARVLPVPAARALDQLAGDTFDVAFLDPPFDAGLLAPTLGALAARDLVARLIVCEHRASDPAPAAPGGWTLADRRRFGDVALALYRKKGPAP